MAGVAALNGSVDPLGLPAFTPVARRRTVAVVQPGTDLPAAPYAAAAGPAGTPVSLASGGDRVAATYDGDRVGLATTFGGHTRHHVSRRHGRVRGAERVALSLTGPFVTAWSRGPDGPWTARAVVDLDRAADAPDAHDPQWLAGLRAEGERSGAFGQLGLRDVRVVTHADGTPYDDGSGGVLLSATSAGPGGFRTAHASVWHLDPDTLEVGHRADLFFRRAGGGRVLGDHAVHVVRDGGRWLVATSTWGDFDRRRPRVGCALATTTLDVTRGTHVLDTAPLDLPTAGLDSRGTWDPHLVRNDDGSWLCAFVSATGWFRFHPALAGGPSLDRLRLVAADPARTATEGVTLHRARHRPGGTWWVLASDGRDGPRATRARYPVLDLDLRERGVLEAAYPTNLPWPTLVERAGHPPLLVGFDGAPAGGPLLGYGSHGALVVQRPRRTAG